MLLAVADTQPSIDPPAPTNGNGRPSQQHSDSSYNELRDIHNQSLIADMSHDVKIEENTKQLDIINRTLFHGDGNNPSMQMNIGALNMGFRSMKERLDDVVNWGMWIAGGIFLFLIVIVILLVRIH